MSNHLSDPHGSREAPPATQLEELDCLESEMFQYARGLREQMPRIAPDVMADRIESWARHMHSDLAGLRVAASVATPAHQLLVEALNATRWDNTKCGACGTSYRRCGCCHQGVKVTIQSRGGQCGGHENKPCSEACIIERAILSLAASVATEAPQRQETTDDELSRLPGQS